MKIADHGILWDGHAAACSQPRCDWAMTLKEAHEKSLNLGSAISKHLQTHGISTVRVDVFGADPL